MTELHTIAHAKLNLTLDVVGKRPDGYHNLQMVMQEITLGDEITLTMGTGEPWLVDCNAAEIPCDESNLAVKAARLFFDRTGLDCGGLTITLKKRTPICAGLGGGSSDGAAVLELLYGYYGESVPERELYAIAEQVGSDVPFALFGGTALAKEKGQVLTRLPDLPACHIVLCKPDFPVSTPALYRAIDREEIRRRPDTGVMLEAIRAGDLARVAKTLYNVFEPMVTREHPELGEIRRILMEFGALGTCMSGSGPTMFGIFDDLKQAETVWKVLRERYAATYLAEPVSALF